MIHMYPELQQELKKIFGWELNQPPSVVLTRDNKKFQQWAHSPLTVAFAVPQRNLVAIDYSRMTRHPFSLRSTFKHELCHLLLHDQITHTPIPRWLDEGVAQWASDGAGDILMDQKRSILNRVALSGRFIPLASLSRGFPAADDALTLAYEESKSFVDYLIRLQGREGVLRLLEQMKKGESVERAVQATYGESLNSLEREWHKDLQNAMTWFTYVSYHLYEILFALAALITIYAAFRIMVKKRRRMKEYVDEPLL